MDRGAWWATVHRITKSWTQLQRLSTHTCRKTKDYRSCGTRNLNEVISPLLLKTLLGLLPLPSMAHKVSSHRSDSPPHCLALPTSCQPHHLPAVPGTQPAHVCHRAFALALASAPNALLQTVTAIPFTSYECLLTGLLLVRPTLASELRLLPLPLPQPTLPGPL